MVEFQVGEFGGVARSTSLVLFVVGWTNVIRVISRWYLAHHFAWMATSSHNSIVLAVSGSCAAPSFSNWVLVVVIWSVINTLITPISSIYWRFVVFSRGLVGVGIAPICQMCWNWLNCSVIKIHFLCILSTLHHKIISFDNIWMDNSAKLWVSHLHLTAAKFRTLVLLRATLGGGLPGVLLGGVVLGLVRLLGWSLLLSMPSNHLILRILRRCMLLTRSTIPMTYSHIHPILNICLRLLRKLRLVSHMLSILEASSSHAHDLRPVVIFFALVVVAARVADSLQLRPVVDSVNFYGRGDHLLGVWAVLSASSFCSNFLCFLTALGGVWRGAQVLFLLNLSIVLVFSPQFINFSLKLKFVPLLCWNIILVTISGICTILFNVANIQCWRLLHTSNWLWSSLSLCDSCTLSSFVGLLLVLV